MPKEAQVATTTEVKAPDKPPARRRQSTKKTTAKKTPTRNRNRSTKKPADPPVDRIRAAALANAERRRQLEAVGLDPDAQQINEYEPLLKLSTAKKKRPTIEIDEVEYELKYYRDFGIGDQHDLTNDGEEFDELWKKPTLDPKEKKRLHSLLDTMVRMVLVAPKEIIDSLDDELRSQIATTFTLAPLQMAARQALKEQEAQAILDNQTQEATTPDT